MEAAKQTPITVRVSNGFPYKSSNGSYSLSLGEPAVAAGQQLAAGKKKASKVPCKVEGCSESVSLKDMRQHIGAHVLQGDIGEEGSMVCGFCGGVCGATTCVASFQKGSIKSVIKLKVDNCPYFVELNYASALKCSNNAPCTNIPIKCPQCGLAVWKYQMLQHMQLQHGGYEITDEDVQQFAVSSEEFRGVMSKQGFSADDRLQELRDMALEADGFSPFWQLLLD